MLLSSLYALGAVTTLVLASPLDKASARDTELRLIKTSEIDPGVWVTEDEKIDNYVSKKIHFVDITDIKDEQTLRLLSTTPKQANESDVDLLRAAVTYPTSLSHQSEANAIIGRLSNSGPQTWLKTLTDYFNRYYRSTYGTQAGTWLLSQVKTIAASNSLITVSTITHSYNQPSIIVKIPGASTDLVIVGAHYDSTGGSTTGRGPGADDNGSGVVVLMEALRVLALAKFAPENTIEFHFYSGEEGGLLGSQGVFSNYKSAGKTVLAFVNQDMAGYSPSGKISVYTDYADSSLTAYARRIAVGYTGAQTTTDTCGYACSDHASAYSNGFPAAYVCDEPISTSSPFIHSADDTYATIMWDAILRHSKFTVGFLVEAAYL